MTTTPQALERPLIDYKLLQEYPEDSIRTYQLVLDGHEQDAQHIIRTKEDGTNELITQQKMLYKLIPNSRVLKAAQEVADEIGAVPWTEFTGPWFVKPDSNIMENERRTQVHALFAFNEPQKIRGDDTIQLGFSIHNSMDGSMGIGGGGFTFRHACENMFFMGFKGQGMRFDDRVSLAYFYRKHTTEINKDAIKATMQKVIDEMMIRVEAIRKMPDLDLTQQQAEKIAVILPKEKIEELGWIIEDGKKVKLTKKVSVYDAWNDLTDYLSHEDAHDLSIETIMNKNKVVEQVLVAPLIRSR